MKKITLIALLLALTWQVNAQTNEIPNLVKNEFKIDAAYLLGLAFKVEFERLINDQSSLGIVALGNPNSDPAYGYQLLGFYRLYFGKEYASGFFLEGNFGITGAKNYTVPGVGLAIGQKFVTKSNVTLDVFIGLGRVFEIDRYRYYAPSIYPRVGVCIGKRF
ncbi:MAG: hypothetical protein FWE63_03875 [Bacteroidales bacterium]|nr:hypothetical protein [Bacteroidales bacterium]